jgi:two-component system OmpR family sensor kinase
MVVALAALATVGLVLADVSGMLLLRRYLIERVDRQLAGQTVALSRRSWPPTEFGGRSRQGPDFGPRAAVSFYTADGTLVPLSGATTVSPDLGGFHRLAAHAGGRPYTVDGADGAWRVQSTMLSDQSGYLVLAVSLREVDETQGTLLLIDVGVTVVVLVGIAIAAATVVRVGLRPLTRMEAAAAEIAGGDLSRRVEDADPHTESGRLGTALNTMLVRIETAMAARTLSERRLRQFLADASHELRTPLTSIQGFAELYRRGGAPPGPALDDAMAAIEAEVGRMRLLVNDLLLLARLDEERPLQRHSVDLLAVAADAVRDAHVRVPTRFVLLGPLDDERETFDPVTVAGDEARLRQVATNLVTNALQHTPDDAEVVLRVGRCAVGGPVAAGGRYAAPAAVVGHGLPPGVEAAVLEVSDTGPGMPPDDASRAFERLYRADVSRSRRHGGAGLGLSIVASIVRAHGGRVELWTAPGAGATFRVLLPAEEAPSQD